MSTTTCPKCGKPLRPGARFCGSCGANLPAAPARPAGTPAAQPAPAAAQPAAPEPDSSPCPKCGKPIRSGARYCSHCGYERPDEVNSAASQTVRTARDDTHATHTTVPAVSPPPHAPLQPAALPPSPAAPAGRSPAQRYLPWLAVAGVLLCVLAVASGGLYLADPFGWFGTATPLAEAPTATSAATASAPQAPPLPAATQPALVQPVETQPAVAAPPSQPPATALPVLLPSSEATVTLQPTLEPVLPTGTLPVSIPVTLPPAAAPLLTTLVEDYFDGELNVNWLAWGSPWPTIDSGPTDSWLVVKSVEDPWSGGVTSKFDMPVKPGTELLFSASLDKIFREAPLYLDWAPKGAEPGPQNPAPGVLHLEIYKDKLAMQNPPSGQTCLQTGDGRSIHTYLLRFTEAGGVGLYVDGSPDPLCELPDLGVKPRVGKITFTGAGWVTYLKVSVP